MNIEINEIRAWLKVRIIGGNNFNLQTAEEKPEPRIFRFFTKKCKHLIRSHYEVSCRVEPVCAGGQGTTGHGHLGPML